MIDADRRDEVRRLVQARLESESSDNLLGLGTVFGLDSDEMEAATPVTRVQMLLDGIDLDQLADILEIKPDAPPPPSDASPAGTGGPTAGPDAPDTATPVEAFELPPGEAEARFAEELPGSAEPASPAEPPVSEIATLEPVETGAGESPPAGVEAGEPEAPPAAPAPLPDPFAPAGSESLDELTAAMMATGDLTPEELAELQKEAGIPPPAPASARQSEEVDVLQELRSVRRTTVRGREREKLERKRRAEDRRKDAIVPPEQKLARIRVYLFRSMMVVFILLFAITPEVVIEQESGTIRFKVPLIAHVIRRVTWWNRLPPPPPPPTPAGPPAPDTPRPPGTPTPPRIDPASTVAPPVADTLGSDLPANFVGRELRTGDLAGTIELASRSLDISTDDLRSQLFQPGSGQPSSELEKAQALLIGHDIPGAERAFRKLAAGKDPAAPLAGFYLGHVLRLEGRLDQAQAAYDVALARDPKLAEALHGTAQLHRARGNANAAIDFCRRARAARPAYLAAQYELAELLQEQGRSDEALATYAELLKRDPKLSYALFSEGLILFRREKPEAAAEKFRKALEANRAWRTADAGLAQNNLGNCLDALKKPEEAMAAYEAAVKLRPEDDLLQYNLARAYQRYEYPQRALAPYERAIALMQLRDVADVGDLYIRALYNAAECYMRIHDFRRAAERYEDVLQIRPGLEIARERQQRALQALDRARELTYQFGTPTVQTTRKEIVAPRKDAQ